MGLKHGYGVLIGTKSSYFRDPPDNFGRYYHGNLIILAPAGNHHCAIDVDPKDMPDGIQWRIVKIRPNDFADIEAIPDGWQPLVSNPNSGALDCIRSRVLHPPIMIWNIRYDSCFYRFLDFIRWNPPWTSGTGIRALTDLEAVIAQGVRFYVFGEPFNNGLGVHNIHHNQGDPVGGGQTARGEFLGFLNKFKTQASDEMGARSFSHTGPGASSLCWKRLA